MLVTHSIENGVGEIVLNRPDKLNALTLEMVEQLHSSLRAAETDGARALVLRRRPRLQRRPRPDRRRPCH